MKPQGLFPLATRYFKNRGYSIQYSVAMEGFSGLFYIFELLIEKEKEKHIVSVKDWTKTVGIDTIIKVDRSSDDINFPNPIIIANKFSDHAKSYANRRGISLITKKDLLKL